MTTLNDCTHVYNSQQLTAEALAELLAWERIRPARQAGIESALLELQARREAEKCKHCHGTGSFQDSDDTTVGSIQCPSCHGTGKRDGDLLAALKERMEKIADEAWRLMDLYGSSVYDGPAACDRILALTKGKR